jgi:hypothetical protein
MSQRHSGFARRPRDDYPTPPWCARVLVPYLNDDAVLWDCAAGAGQLVRALRRLGYTTVGTSDDFLARRAPPDRKRRFAIVTNSLTLDVAMIAMLLKIDFDSGSTRVHLFQDCPQWARKIVLLDRIKWFAGPSEPSENHAWYVWNQNHRGPPIISYAEREQ